MFSLTSVLVFLGIIVSDLQPEEPKGIGPIHTAAARDGGEECVRLLLEARADVNSRTKVQLTHMSPARFGTSNNCDCCDRSSSSFSFLLRALLWRSTHLIQLLLSPTSRILHWPQLQFMATPLH